MKIEIDERQILTVQKTQVVLGMGAGIVQVDIPRFLLDKQEATVLAIHDVYVIILRNKEEMVKP